QRETRTFLRLRGRALLFTIAATAALVVSVGLIAALPAVCGLLGIRETGVLVAGVLRWPLLAALVLVGFSALYRFGPDRAPARWRWVTPGSLVATVIWLAASAGFALYAAVAGSFDETYGPLGGVVVLLLWLHLSSLAVLVGAEVNAEMEHQTARDTTTGPDRPLGARGAVVADTVGASSQERRTPPDGVDSSPDRE
ncbi:MAG TPA: YihY/virulence factor BrkB family protein, partial [Acidimicrobiales bacterium]|nr:YihY/virulence factor BrkB family protein [Acidimicrobiales bacterium]